MEAQPAASHRSGHRRRPLFSAELDYTRQRAANSLHDVADWLEEVDVQDLMRRAEGWARRHPAVFLGGTFALGLIAARVYKGGSHLAAERADAAKRASNEDAATGRNRGSRSQRVPFYPEADLPYRDDDIRESTR